MYNLHLIKYNNYCNKIIRKPSKLISDADAIIEYDRYESVILSGINFIPNDGVQTSQIVNTNYITDNDKPDYLVVTNTLHTEIISRWFIIKTTRLVNNQYKLELKRDIFVDHFNDIINATGFIEQGELNYENPLILNDEGIALNKIKKSEHLIKDYTNMAWVVGYVARNAADVDANTPLSFKTNNYYDVEYTNINEYPYYSSVNKNVFDYNSNISIKIPLAYKYGSNSPIATNKLYNINIFNDNVIKEDDRYRAELNSYIPNMLRDNRLSNNQYLDYSHDFSSQIAAMMTHQSAPALSILHSAFSNTIEFSNDYNNLLRQSGKVIKTSNGYYRVKLSNISNIDSNICTNNSISLYANSLTEGLQYTESSSVTFELSWPTADNYPVFCTINSQGVIMELEEIDILSNNEYNVSFNANRNHVQNSAYDMFCMPYGNLKFTKSGITDIEINTSEENSLAIGTGLGSISSFIYDLQLLPFCPIRNLIINEGEINLDTIPTQNYYFIKDSQDISKYVILWASNATFTFNYDYSITAPNTAANLKLHSQTDIWRLCSPNYNGQFEFNAYKNRTPNSNVAVSHFNVDCSYKPYSPYIHINPNFNGLYGNEFNDARGLICGGDFSLDIISDAWNNYQIQNKNYQNIFNREIDNIEVQHKWQMAEAFVNGVAGSGINGGAMGAVMGGPVMGAIGGAAGLGQGLLNLAETRALYKENLDYKNDMYNYQLDNIKSLPYNLTKVSSLNGNNKIYPFIEFYTCTDEELDVMTKYINFNGMKIGRIGTIRDYLSKSSNKYIKAKLIKLEYSGMDSNEMQDIANELALGLFVRDN